MTANHSKADRPVGDEDPLAELERYRLLFTGMLEGYAYHQIILDEAGSPIDYRFIAVNPAFERMTGMKAETLVGRTVREVLPAVEPYWIENYGRVALGGNPLSFENDSAELGRRYAVTAFSPRHGHFAVLVQDVTEQRETEEALRKSEASYIALIDNRQETIWSVDREYRYQKFNRYFAAAYLRAYGEELRPGIRVPDILPADRWEFWKPRYDAALAGMSQIFEFSEVIGGEAHVFEVGLNPISTEEGVIGVSALSTEVTEKRRQEAELRRLVVEKDTLMRELRHRIKNGLGVIASLIELELGQGRGQEADDVLRKTLGRIDAFQELYERLRGDEGLVSVDLAEYLREISSMITEVFAAEAGTIEIDLRLESHRIEAARAVPVGLAFNELLTNALKYAFPGGSRGRIRVTLSKDGDSLLLVVEDDGAGFDPSRRGAGGIGLMLVDLLAKQLGGKVSYETRKGTKAILSFAER